MPSPASVSILWWMHAFSPPATVSGMAQVDQKNHLDQTDLCSAKTAISAAKAALLAVAFCASVSVLCVAVPTYVIRPFRPQGARELALALALRQSGPLIAGVCTALAVLIVALAWQRVSTRAVRIGLIASVALVCAAAVLTHVNIFEHMFHPYDSPAFDAASAASIEPDDMVMAVRVGTDSRAYPIRAMGYHHIVNDTVGGVPIAATYCTLCHTGLVWKRIVDGRTLRFRLAGINNGNALMRDEQSGTIWQQTTGLAIFGPLKGTQLEQLHNDELTFALWRREQPTGLVLRPEAEFASEYESKQWEQHIAKYRSVIDTSRTGIAPRELMIGVGTSGTSKAYPLQLVLGEKMIQDRVGDDRVLLLVGPDNISIRAFRTQAGGANTQNSRTFIRQADGGAHSSERLVIDTETGSAWNFQGCAVAGKLTGLCLEPIDATKDYWFDWLNYHPSTTVYRN